jgi:uncharacterized protein involved in exopolysaccharide biosynthesis
MSKMAESAHTEDTTRDLARFLWSHRWRVTMVSLAAAIVAGASAFIMPKEYEATVLVAPVVDDLGSGQLGKIGALLSQVGGLASLAGISAPNNTQREETIATIQSMSLIQEFIRQNDLLPVLYAEKWDAQSKRWKSNSPSKVPTLWKASDQFRKRVVRFVDNRKTGLLNVTITWSDPETAAKWANKLVELANEQLRTKALMESERNIAYLNQAAASTNVVDVQKTIYSLMEAELRRSMLANGTNEYALKVIDRAIAPERASAPRKGLWIFTGLFGGFFGSVLFFLACRTLSRLSLSPYTTVKTES